METVAIRGNRSAHQEQQRQHRQADQEQELEVVDIGDDRGLPRDLRIESGHARRGRRVPEQIGGAGLQRRD